MAPAPDADPPLAASILPAIVALAVYLLQAPPVSGDNWPVPRARA